MQVDGQHHVPAALISGITPVPTECEAGWTQKHSGHFGEEKHCVLTGFRIPHRPTYTVVAIPTALLLLLAAMKSKHNITTRRGLSLAATHQTVDSEFISAVSAAYHKFFIHMSNSRL